MPSIFFFSVGDLYIFARNIARFKARLKNIVTRQYLLIFWHLRVPLSDYVTCQLIGVECIDTE